MSNYLTSQQAILKVIWKELFQNTIACLFIVIGIFYFLTKSHMTISNLDTIKPFLYIVIIGFSVVISAAIIQIQNKYFGDDNDRGPTKLFILPVSDNSISGCFFISGLVACWLITIPSVLIMNLLLKNTYLSLYIAITLSSLTSTIMLTFSIKRLVLIPYAIFCIPILFQKLIKYTDMADQGTVYITTLDKFLFILFYACSYIVIVRNTKFLRHKKEPNIIPILRYIVWLLFYPFRMFANRKTLKFNNVPQVYYWYETQRYSHLFNPLIAFICPLLFVLGDADIQSIFAFLCLMIYLVQKALGLNTGGFLPTLHQLPFKDEFIALTKIKIFYYNLIKSTFIYLLGVTLFTKGRFWVWLVIGPGYWYTNEEYLSEKYLFLIIVLIIYWTVPGIITLLNYWKLFQAKTMSIKLFHQKKIQWTLEDLYYFIVIILIAIVISIIILWKQKGIFPYQLYLKIIIWSVIILLNSVLMYSYKCMQKVGVIQKSFYKIVWICYLGTILAILEGFNLYDWSSINFYYNSSSISFYINISTISLVVSFIYSVFFILPHLIYLERHK